MSGHVVESLSAYLDRELEAAERHAVEAHLQLCDECTRHLENLAAVDDLARGLPLEVPRGYFEALPARVRFKVTSRRRGLPRLPAWSWAVAAALLLAVITPALLERTPKPAEVARSLAPSAPVSAPAAEEKQRPARPQPLSTGGPAPAAELRASASRQEVDSAPMNRARAVPAPAFPAAPAPALSGGAAQGTLASNAVAAPLAKTEGAVAKDKAKEESPQDLGRTARSAGAPSASFATPPEAPVEGPAGQHLYEPKAESDEADSPAAAAVAKKLAPGPQPASAGRRDGEADARLDRIAPRLRFRDLTAEVPHNLEDARRLRERWRTFVAQGPSAVQADEGRVRIVEVGVQAWRLSNDPADLVLVKSDALAYLRRDDAAQGDRVRTLVSTLGN